MDCLEDGVPKTCIGVLQGDNGNLQLSQNVPVPEVLPGWLLVRTAVISLSPCDFKMPKLLPSPGLKGGLDFAGTVVARGQGVEHFQLGDRVLGAVVGNKTDDPESGAFSQYVRIESVFALKIPENVSLEASIAWIPSYIFTAALALHQGLGLPDVLRARIHNESEEAKNGNRETVLVHGGSSCVGLMTLQMLKIHGFHVITTCSEKNSSLVKLYGADAVFDYHDQDCARAIREYTKDRLRYVIDPFGEPGGTAMCVAALGRRGGIYCCLEQYHADLVSSRRTVKHCLIMGPAVSGRGVELPEPYGVSPDAKLESWATSFCYPGVQKLLDSGSLRPVPVRILEGGWGAVIHGLELLEGKGVSGQKLIVLVE
ncbi:hypothetical protein QTJ16_006097 [Diplocarpon rosae]|uniref:Enoyl reductase (ER) domain-containing protein n=1 Tax=Diplocarpon rosae TaxID=946125 RepID=A0AAD9WDJ0_9HELO|nr:hypothetical protein QTJ16_006097 [Diplocarpon rosae]